MLLSSCGCRFPRFPVSVSDCFLAVFALLGCRFAPFATFPVRFPPCRGVPRGCALSLFACSRLVPRLVLRAVVRGNGACLMVWVFVPWRGVAGMAGCLAVSLGVSFPVGALGGAFWLVFSYGIIGWVVREKRCGGEAVYLRRQGWREHVFSVAVFSCVAIYLFRHRLYISLHACLFSFISSLISISIIIQSIQFI